MCYFSAQVSSTLLTVNSLSFVTVAKQTSPLILPAPVGVADPWLWLWALATCSRDHRPPCCIGTAPAGGTVLFCILSHSWKKRSVGPSAVALGFFAYVSVHIQASLPEQEAEVNQMLSFRKPVEAKPS